MPDAFKRDPNRVPDVDTTRGRSVGYEDTSFLTGDSPAVHDVNTDLGRNGRDGYLINDGEGSFKVSFSDDGTTYGSNHTIKAGEILRFKGVDIDKIKVTWVANSAYRIFVL